MLLSKSFSWSHGVHEGAQGIITSGVHARPLWKRRPHKTPHSQPESRSVVRTERRSAVSVGRLGRFVPVVSLLLFTACTFPTVESPSKPTTERDMPRLTLVLSIETGSNERGPRIELTVTNVGKEPITWDTKFSVFLKWHLNYLDGTKVDALLRWDIAKPTAKEVDERFISLSAGETIKKTFDLSGYIRCFGSGGVRLSDGMHGRYTGTEYEFKYKFRDSRDKVKLIVEYRVGQTDSAGFREWFNSATGKYKFCDETISSNSLILDSGTPPDPR